MTEDELELVRSIGDVAAALLTASSNLREDIDVLVDTLRQVGTVPPLGEQGTIAGGLYEIAHELRCVAKAIEGKK